MTHLLLVEDDPMLGDALQTALQRELGARVDWVQAQLALVDHAYQLILLDIGLPGQSGLALLRALREGYDTTPVLL
ncbi:response regulator, partial [Bordetella pertussis]